MIYNLKLFFIQLVKMTWDLFLTFRCFGWLKANASNHCFSYTIVFLGIWRFRFWSRLPIIIWRKIGNSKQSSKAALTGRDVTLTFTFWAPASRMRLYYVTSLKLMKLPTEFLRGKAHQYHSGEAKRRHVPATALEKTTFAVAGFEPRTFWSRVSDVPTRTLCSNYLKMECFQ